MAVCMDLKTFNATHFIFCCTFASTTDARLVKTKCITIKKMRL